MWLGEKQAGPGVLGLMRKTGRLIIKGLMRVCIVAPSSKQLRHPRRGHSPHCQKNTGSNGFLEAVASLESDVTEETGMAEQELEASGDCGRSRTPRRGKAQTGGGGGRAPVGMCRAMMSKMIHSTWPLNIDRVTSRATQKPEHSFRELNALAAELHGQGRGRRVPGRPNGARDGARAPT